MFRSKKNDLKIFRRSNYEIPRIANAAWKAHPVEKLWEFYFFDPKNRGPPTGLKTPSKPLARRVFSGSRKFRIFPIVNQPKFPRPRSPSEIKLRRWNFYHLFSWIPARSMPNFVASAITIGEIEGPTFLAGSLWEEPVRSTHHYGGRASWRPETPISRRNAMSRVDHGELGFQAQTLP